MTNLSSHSSYNAAIDDPDNGIFSKVVLEFTEIEFAKLGIVLDKTDGFLGSADSSEFLSVVYKWRKFFPSSSLYGYRLGKNVSIRSKYPFAEYEDLLLTDSSRVTKNDYENPDSALRISAARLSGHKVVGFFGGSTIQGYGCRVPQHTIPSQVEKILSLVYGIDAVCINYGVAGWTCIESHNLLVNEAGDVNDAAVFYDGWNCCYDFYMREIAILKGLNGQSNPDIFPGTSFRHVELDFINGMYFNSLHLLKRSISLTVNHLFCKFCDLLPSNRFRNFLNSILQKYFTLATRRLIASEIADASLSEAELSAAVKRAADEYLKTHRKIVRYCADAGIQMIHAFQPLLVNSSKIPSLREKLFLISGLPWGKPLIASLFRDAISLQHEIDDFSDSFDCVLEEVFVDSGHINEVGNFHVSWRLAGLLAQRFQQENKSVG